MGNQFVIRRHYPAEVQFWISEEPSKAPTLNVEAQIRAESQVNKENPLDWRVVIHLTFTGKEGEEVVARGLVRYAGFFDLPADLPDTARAQFIVQQGSSILYGAARELVANLSCRAPYRVITLPPAIFNKMVQEKPPEAPPQPAVG